MLVLMCASNLMVDNNLIIYFNFFKEKFLASVRPIMLENGTVTCIECSICSVDTVINIDERK